MREKTGRYWTNYKFGLSWMLDICDSEWIVTLDSNNVYDLCDEYDDGRKIQAAHEKHVGHVTLEEKLTMAGSTSPCTDVSSSL